jgi:hypothetical protein
LEAFVMSNQPLSPNQGPKELLDDPSVQQLRDALRVAVPVEGPDIVQKRRERLVASIEGEIRNLPAHRRREEQKQLWAVFLRYGGAAAVLVATLGLGMLLTPDRSLPAMGSNQPSSLSMETSPGPGSVLVSKGNAERVFELPGKTLVSLRRDSRVTLIDDSISSQVMKLEAGSVFVSVPPATGDTHRSVSVLTPHAQVKVKGTRFSVDLLEKPNEKRTRVLVERGVVEVTHAGGVKTLRAGQSWVSAPLALLPEEVETHVGTTATRDTSQAIQTAGTSQSDARSRTSQFLKGEAASARDNSSSSSTPRLSPLATKESTLSVQNALLEAALVAADGGNEKRALELTGQLLREYPNSPLRASAQAVRRRVQEESAAPRL